MSEQATMDARAQAALKKVIEYFEYRRKELGLTKKQVADRTGMNPFAVSKILNGKVENIYFDTYWKMATALELTTTLRSNVMLDKVK